MAMLPALRDRLYLARRAAYLGRQTGLGLSPEAAERAIAAWEAEAAARGLKREAPDYWTMGEAWIAAQGRRWT